MLLFYLQRQNGRPRIDKWFCHSLRSFKGLAKFPLRLDRRYNVQALSASRLHERMVTEAFQMRFEFQREFRDLFEGERLGRIKIVGDVVGLIKMRCARMHLMQFDAREICEPRE